MSSPHEILAMSSKPPREQALKTTHFDVESSTIMEQEPLNPYKVKFMNVNTIEQLASVSPEFLSGNPTRPLLSRDVGGNEYQHYLRPMLNAAAFIMLVEGLERLCFFGVSYTQTSFLEGAYNANNQGWSPNMSTTAAVGLTSLKMGLAFTYPFFGAIIADTFIGNYWTILLFSLLCYLPGLILIALVSKPYLFGDTFPMKPMYAAYLFFYPCGAGAIKTCVNVMGAQQFHPVLQKGAIDQFYIKFYMAINCGSLIGGLVIPTIVRQNPFAGYMIPVVVFSLGISIFILGSSRYTKMKPSGINNLKVLKISGIAICGCQGLEKQKLSNGGRYPDVLVRSIKQLAAIIPITTLCVPFNIVWGEMMGMIQAQGIVMQNVGFVDAAWMQNFDAIAVILCGAVVGSWFYPYYERRTGRQMKLSTKFIIGNTFGTLGIIYALLIDIYIVREFERSGQPLNIFWQAPSFICIGFGEIFVVSSAFTAVFRIAPKNLKALSSAVNNFIGGGVPQYLIKLSVMFTARWFIAADGSDQLNNLPAYATANTLKYFGCLVGMSIMGLLINMLPAVDRFLERMLATAEKADRLEETNAKNDSHPFNLTDNDKTERVDETNHTETMQSGADRASFMINGYSSTSIN